MIKREEYLKKIRPFMSKEIVKVLTGIRRCGKSVMLELIKEDLVSQGIKKENLFSVNFETGAVSYVKSLEETYEAVSYTHLSRNGMYICSGNIGGCIYLCDQSKNEKEVEVGFFLFF